MATRNDITNIVAYIKLAFPNYNPIIEGGLTTIDVLEDLLGDVPYQELQLAVKACCLESGRAFAPSPGEIRGKVAGIRVKNTGLETGSAVWAECRESIVRMPAGNLSGGGSSLILDHPATMETLRRMGGFPQICLDIENGQESFTRSRFLKIYDEVVDSIRSEISEHPALTDYDNRALEEKTKADIKMLADKFGGRNR